MIAPIISFILANWRVIAGVAVVSGAFLAGWQVNQNRWELKHAQEIKRMYEAGKSATDNALNGWKKDLEDFRNRPPAPVVRLRKCVPATAGGTAPAGPEGQPPAVGDGNEEGRLIGRITADVLDEADLNAARCNRLIQWYRESR